MNMEAPNPLRFFEAINAYQQTEAIKAAVELDLFTAIAEAKGEVSAIAARCGAAERGVRILCDFLTTFGFLIKSGERYGLAPDIAMFLVKGSPAYLGSSIDFLLAPELVNGFRDLAGAVRRGGTTISANGTMEDQHPVWVKFAHVMGPVIARSAPLIAEIADPKADQPLRVLDIAAGHGLFGIACARRNRCARIVAQDWAPVLEVAREHAKQAGVADRYELLPGNAFDIELGGDYDIVLVTNFLHHFDTQSCERLLARVKRSLKPGGSVVTLEFVPGADRLAPAPAARFSATMLATTAGGDAYTFSEYDAMFRRSGFGASTLHALPESPQSVIVSKT